MKRIDFESAALTHLGVDGPALAILMYSVAISIEHKTLKKLCSINAVAIRALVTIAKKEER